MKSPEPRLRTLHFALTTILLALNILDHLPCLMGDPNSACRTICCLAILLEQT